MKAVWENDSLWFINRRLKSLHLSAYITYKCCLEKSSQCGNKSCMNIARFPKVRQFPQRNNVPLLAENAVGNYDTEDEHGRISNCVVIVALFLFNIEWSMSVLYVYNNEFFLEKCGPYSHQWFWKKKNIWAETRESATFWEHINQ